MPVVFFLSDIYGPRDFNQRDQDIVQVYHSVGRFFPPQIIEDLELVIELNDLTLELDDKLLQVLTGELHAIEIITPDQYTEAYRRCDNYDQRVRQIGLIVNLGKALNRLVHAPVIGLTLRLAHQPARWLGWAELQDFLERGYDAFKGLADAERFIKLI